MIERHLPRDYNLPNEEARKILDRTRSEPPDAVHDTVTVLGLESSCDETAAAVVRRTPDGSAEILSNVVLSQLEDHAPYGGVVPEIAARAHVEHMDGVAARALAEAGLGTADMDAFAATAGPGLIGGVIVALMTAKSLALVHGRPLFGINHLEGHALTCRMTDGLEFPYLLLLVSGGHTQLVTVEGVGRYRRLGTTIDDALGEAFDKTAKLLGLGYPGGPAVETAARAGDPARFAFPRPLSGRPGFDFSFSGLKTAVRRAAESIAPVSDADVADICAAFQQAVSDSVRDRTAGALRHFREAYSDLARPHLVVAGGVAANRALRGMLEDLCAEEGFALVAPDLHLCTDNGAMIAWAGAERLVLGPGDPLDISPRARWPLDETPPPPPLEHSGDKAGLSR